jgi:hypothetical protein
VPALSHSNYSTSGKFDKGQGLVDPQTFQQAWCVMDIQ